MSDYIPVECCLQILKRLPAKSLARFRCVCKRWNALICSSSFIADHLACSKSKRRLFIYGVHQPRAPREKGSVIFDSDSPDVDPASFFHTFTTDARFEGDFRYELVGSVKGVVCLNDGRDIVLWNPAINKYMNLPKKRIPFFTSFKLQMPVAIGVKPSEDDDIRVFTVSAIHSMDKDGIVNVVSEIYSVRHGGWRVIQADTPSFHFIGDHGVQSYANGAVHWVVRKKDSSLFILCFDFENEEFGSISLGESLGRFNCYKYAAVYGGKLAVVEVNHAKHSRTIWVMSEYGNSDSWSVVTCIDCSSGRYMHIKGITNDGHILLSPGLGDEMLMYDSTSRTYSKPGMKATDNRFCGCDFTESLVFMDGEGGAVSLSPRERLQSTSICG